MSVEAEMVLVWGPPSGLPGVGASLEFPVPGRSVWVVVVSRVVGGAGADEVIQVGVSSADPGDDVVDLGCGHCVGAARVGAQELVDGDDGALFVVGYPFRAKEVDGLGLVVVHEAEPIGCEFCLCVFGRGNEGSIGGCVGAVASAFEVVHGDEYGWL